MNIGAYAPGASIENDVAVQARPKIVNFLRQPASQPSSFDASKKQTMDLAAWTEQLEKSLRVQAAKPGPRAANAVK